MKRVLIITIIAVAFLCNCAYAQSKSISVHVSATIVPDFNLTAQQQNDSSLNLTAQEVNKQKAGPDTVSIQLQTASNLGQPYQISQHVSQPRLSNETAAILQENIITAGGDNNENEITYPRPNPITVKPAVVFVSNAKGTAELLNIQYKVKEKTSNEEEKNKSSLVYTICAI